MSLNGLDDPKLKEAHDAAVADAGGWYVVSSYSSKPVDEMRFWGSCPLRFFLLPNAHQN